MGRSYFNNVHSLIHKYQVILLANYDCDSNSNQTSSSYLALARKYRPSNFSELVGQEVLVTTLSNAINKQRLHHAYILTGIRGVGKTTTARIIAKSFNCLGDNWQQDNGLDNVTRIACGVCQNCRLIAASKHQDVIEIDAASKTGVDDIREIIESIAYRPVMARHKIYIIDEVHMLSNSAFNALLKTLEEPPAHAKFIFATTEIKKVPITILSRCQRFDLRRLDEKEIAVHLNNIMAKEGYSAEEGALSLIAKMSEGSLRDSLSILDQALSVNNYQQSLPLSVVEKMLLVNDKNKLIELYTAILSGDFAIAIAKFEEFYNYSSDIGALIEDLMVITHKITAIKLIPTYSLEEYSSWQREKLLTISVKVPLSALTRIWQMLLKGLNEVHNSNCSKIVFEMLLARICYLHDLPDLQSVIQSVNNNETKVSVSKIEHNSDSGELTKQKDGQKKDPADDELVSEVLRNFSGSKLIST